MMQSVLGVLAAASFAAAALLVRVSDAQLQAAMSARPAVQRGRKSLKNSHFVLAIAVLVAAEGLLLAAAGATFALALPFLALSAWVPMNFLFFCNLIGVGSRRELLWTCVLVGLSLGSLALFGQLRTAFIVPPSLGLTLVLCHQARRDPYCRYRRGMRLFDERGDVVLALAHLERSVALDPADSRFGFHLGRAYAAAGRREEGQRLMRRALEHDPNLEARLREEHFFHDDWLVLAAATSTGTRPRACHDRR